MISLSLAKILASSALMSSEEALDVVLLIEVSDRSSITLEMAATLFLLVFLTRGGVDTELSLVNHA